MSRNGNLRLPLLEMWQTGITAIRLLNPLGTSHCIGLWAPIGYIVSLVSPTSLQGPIGETANFPSVAMERFLREQDFIIFPLPALWRYNWHTKNLHIIHIYNLMVSLDICTHSCYHYHHPGNKHRHCLQKFPYVPVHPFFPSSSCGNIYLLNTFLST